VALSYGPGENKDKIIDVMMQFASYAMDLGATQEYLQFCVSRMCMVHDYVTSNSGPREPNHADRLRQIITALCWYAPCVGVALDDVRGWVGDRIEYLDDIRNIMRDLRRARDVFAAATSEHGQ